MGDRVLLRRAARAHLDHLGQEAARLGAAHAGLAANTRVDATYRSSPRL